MVEELKGKNIVVVGLARSGLGAANLLVALGANVTVNDMKEEGKLLEYIKDLDPKVTLALGGHKEEIFLNSDMLVLSPGIPITLEPISKAMRKGIPVIGELELAYQAINYFFKPVNNKIEFLAITGTNGKSTTTTLVNHILIKNGFKTIFGGNIGNSLTGEIIKLMSTEKDSLKDIDYVVAEVSSFQLETINRFRPKGAVITNITPDHMDRYHSLDEYINAKAMLFRNQRENDFLILNADDKILLELYNTRLSGNNPDVPDIFFFSRNKGVKGVYLKDDYVCINLGEKAGLLEERLIKTTDIGIKGVHNLENAMAAVAMAVLTGCSRDVIRGALVEFEGLEHRVEFVRELGGVKYFNDSKGTNVAAVIKSVESFNEPIILIAGGRDKEGDFEALKDVVKGKVKVAVLIGEAKEKIKKALKEVTETIEADDLKEAVNISHKIANKGDVVLLSPACASFDMFENFEDRGRKFKKYVMELKDGKM